MQTKLIKSYNLALIIVMGLGCAGKAKMQPPVQAVELSPAPVANNGITGNTLSRWVDRTPTLSSSPRAGEDCAMIYDPRQHRLVLFGGKNDDDQNLNEVWTFDLTKNAWEKINVEGECPPASEDHVVIYDPLSHRMILHGGENGLTWNNTWSFDLQTQRWRNMTDSTAPAREDHTAIFDSRGKRMVIFGGRNNNGVIDDINKYDLRAFDLDPGSATFEKWQNLAFDKKHPLGRSDHVAVFDSLKNRMIIYGGWDKEEKEYLDDTWAFYFAPQGGDSVGHWKQIKTKKSHPPKRRHAVGVHDSDRNWLIISGGFGDAGYLNDVWAFDLNLDEWINITPGPQPRLDHQAIYDPARHCMILYGGDARLKGKFHDLWELQIRSDLPPGLLTSEVTTKITGK